LTGETNEVAVVPNDDGLTPDGLNEFFTLTLEERQSRAEGMVSRMMAAFEITGKGKLAAILGSDSKAPGKWIKKGKVPEKAILFCHYTTGHSLDWLYDGKQAPIVIDKKAFSALQTETKKWLIKCGDMDWINQAETGGFDISAQKITKAMVACLIAQSR
jgi:hypothetical protein